MCYLIFFLSGHPTVARCNLGMRWKKWKDAPVILWQNVFKWLGVVWETKFSKLKYRQLCGETWTTTSNTHSLGCKIYNPFDCNQGKTEQNLAEGAPQFQDSSTILPVVTLFWYTIPHLEVSFDERICSDNKCKCKRPRNKNFVLVVQNAFWGLHFILDLLPGASKNLTMALAMSRSWVQISGNAWKCRLYLECNISCFGYPCE